MSNRINYIDVAKGLGIVLVVLFHIPDCNKMPFFGLITMFYMPLFFLMSGLFFKPLDKKGMIKKTKSILVPYLTFYVVCFAIFSAHNVLIGIDSYLLYFFAFLFGATNSPTCMPMWFLLSLFEMFLIMSLIVKIPNKYIQCVIALFLGLGGYLLGKAPNILVNVIPLMDYTSNANYYFIASTLLCLPFFAFGSVFRKFFLKQNLMLGSSFLILGMTIHYFDSKWVGTSLCNVQMNIFLFYLSSFFMIYAFIQFCMVIQEIKYVEKVLSYYGRNSIIVLCFHIPLVPLYKYIHIYNQQISVLMTLLVIMLIEVFVIKFINSRAPFMIGKF